MHCPGKSNIPSLDWAIDTCHAKGGWLATPQNYVDDTTIQALVTTVLGGLTNDYYVLLGGSDAWMESRWIWVDGPEKGRMFWTGTIPYPSETGVPIAGRYVPPPDRFWPEVTSSGSSGDLMVWFYPSAIAWGDVPNFNSITCYACQYQTCAHMCNATHTASFTGEWWPDCACKCKPGWRGVMCDIQFTSHCTAGHVAIGNVAAPIADCHSRGGYLATPRSFVDDSAIYSLGNITPSSPGPTTYTLTAGSDSGLLGYWRWLDGPEEGDLFWVGFSPAGTAAPTAPLDTRPRYTNMASSQPDPPSSGSAGDSIILFDDNGVRWGNKYLSSTLPSYWACQYSACTEVCNMTNTITASDGEWPNCTCSCKRGWGGPRCTEVLIETPTANVSMRCPGSGSIPSLQWAVDRCHAFGGWLATPQSAFDDHAILNLSHAYYSTDVFTLLGGSDAANETHWLFIDGPDKGRMFWLGALPAASGGNGHPVGGLYSTPVFLPEAEGTGSSGDLLVFSPHPTYEYYTGDLPDIASVACYACMYQSCAHVCNVSHTASFTGDFWPNCVCKCKPGWRGERCSVQFTSHCTGDAASFADIPGAIASCRSRGGYLAAPRSPIDDSAIVSLGNISTTVFTWLGGSDSTQEGTWRWLDGPKKDDVFFVGYGSDYGLPGGSAPTPSPWEATAYTNFPPYEPEPTGRSTSGNNLVLWERSFGSFDVFWGDWNVTVAPSAAAQCYVCQYSACDEVCNMTNTAVAVGTEWPDCSCSCKEGWGGPNCQCRSLCHALGTSTVTLNYTSVFCGCNCLPNFRGRYCNETTRTPTATPTRSSTSSTSLQKHSSSVSPMGSSTTTSSATTTLSQTVASTISLPESVSSNNTLSVSQVTLHWTMTRTQTESPSRSLALLATSSLPVSVSDRVSQSQLQHTKSLFVSESTNNTGTTSNANTGSKMPTHTITLQRSFTGSFAPSLSLGRMGSRSAKVSRTATFPTHHGGVTPPASSSLETPTLTTSLILPEHSTVTHDEKTQRTASASTSSSYMPAFRVNSTVLRIALGQLPIGRISSSEDVVVFGLSVEMESTTPMHELFGVLGTTMDNSTSTPSQARRIPITRLTPLTSSSITPNSGGFFANLPTTAVVMILNSTHVQISLDPVASYSIDTDEYLELFTSRRAICGDYACENKEEDVDASLLVVTIHIRAPQKSEVGKGVNTGVVVVGGVSGMASEVQLLSVIAMMGCADPKTAVSFNSFRVLSPTAISESYSGVVLGNFALALGVALIQLCVLGALQRRRECAQLLQHMSTARFPSFTILSISAFQVGTAFASAQLVSQPSKYYAWEVAVGAFGMAFSVSLPLCLSLHPYLRVERAYQSYNVEEWLMQRSWPWWIKYVLPRGAIFPVETRQAYGFVHVGAFASPPRQIWWNSASVWVATIIAVATLFHPTTVLGCQVLLCVIGLLILATGVSVVMCSPLRTPASNMLQFISAIVVAALFACAAAALEDDAASHTSVALVFIGLTLVAVLVVRIFITLFGAVVEQILSSDNNVKVSLVWNHILGNRSKVTQQFVAGMDEELLEEAQSRNLGQEKDDEQEPPGSATILRVSTFFHSSDDSSKDSVMWPRPLPKDWARDTYLINQTLFVKRFTWRVEPLQTILFCLLTRQRLTHQTSRSRNPSRMS